ncbi:MAG: prenyltransferase/squalene oxidase repeat-containing protein [Thermodesulfovibrionales bacterium]
MKKAILVLFLFHYLFISSVFAQTPEITNGLNYLTSTQNPDGSWGSESTTTEILPSTVSVIEALQTFNQTGTYNYTNAVSWLQVEGLDTTDYLSERIHAISVAGSDSDLLLAYLDELIYAWGGYEGFYVNNLDTVLALQALKKINYSDQNTIEYALNYLIASQNTDGGWGLKTGFDSEVYYTALVSSILQQFPQTTSIATAINKATVYLINQQKTDGSWGTIYETAYAYLALVGVPSTSSGLGQSLLNAINYLGSFVEKLKLGVKG